MVMVYLTVYLKKVKMFSFFIMPNMITNEVISVINSLDKNQIFRFIKHFVLLKHFLSQRAYCIIVAFR